MKKWQFLLIIILTSPFIGGIYGILHDQVTFSIAPEYYTKFKFQQFGLAPTQDVWVPDNIRFYVSIVGIMATWWVGLIIGGVLALISLIHHDEKRRFRMTLRAIGITLTIAVMFGIIGYLYGIASIKEDYATNSLPDSIQDKTAFLTVASIHNLSYLGGLLGLLVAIGYSILQRQPKK